MIDVKNTDTKAADANTSDKAADANTNNKTNLAYQQYKFDDINSYAELIDSTMSKIIRLCNAVFI